MTKTISKTKVAEYERLWSNLQRVSHEALAKATPPRPMIVGTPTTPFGTDIDYSKQVWYEADGLCGFAWVVLSSGRSGFAKWIIETGKGYKHYQWGGGYKGVQFSVSGRGFAETRQSYELKMQLANAMAEYLRSVGIDAWADGRLD